MSLNLEGASDELWLCARPQLGGKAMLPAKQEGPELLWGNVTGIVQGPSFLGSASQLCWGPEQVTSILGLLLHW